METAKLNNKAIIDIFDLEQSELFDVVAWITIDEEDASDLDIDTLMDILCDGEYDPLKYYTKFAKTWCDPDHTYELQMTNGEDDNELTLRTVLNIDPRDPDLVFIRRSMEFTPIDLFKIISAINSQAHFHDLYIAIDKDNDGGAVSGTVYHEESFANSKTWISDLMNLLVDYELDEYNQVMFASDFYELDLETTDGVVRDNRLYVRFMTVE